MGNQAHILAIRVDSIGGCLGWGISNHPGDRLTILGAEVWAGPRPVLETDEEFVQPIPYVVVKHGNRYLSYTRSQKGGEGRLHDKVSIGVGGHIDAADAVFDVEGAIDLEASLDAAAIREIMEELGLSKVYIEEVDIGCALSWTHVISDHTDEVGRVHIGFVAVVDVDRLPTIDPNVFEDTMENVRWRTLAELGALDNLESWTALVVRSLSQQGA